MSRLTWAQTPEQHLRQLPPVVTPVPKQSFPCCSSCLWAIVGVGLPGRDARASEVGREQRNGTPVSQQVPPAVGAPSLKTLTSGHHDADCRPRHGHAGSDDSGSVLDLFAVTACARQPACPPRPKGPNAPVSGRPAQRGPSADCRKPAIDRAGLRARFGGGRLRVARLHVPARHCCNLLVPGGALMAGCQAGAS
jgi:hypothetical protein